MNPTENNRFHCLKTAVFMILCLLAFSAIANRHTDQDSFRDNILTSQDHEISAQAILSAATYEVTTSNLIGTPDNKSRLCSNNKLAFDNRIFNQHFITLQKSRETIIPIRIFLYFLRIIPANPDDLPDLS